MGTKERPGAFDCYAAAEPDEPIFVLLARDEDAPDRVEDWARRRFERLAREHQGVSWPAREGIPESDRVILGLRKIAEALTCAQQMREWRHRTRLRGTASGDTPTFRDKPSFDRFQLLHEDAKARKKGVNLDGSLRREGVYLPTGREEDCLDNTEGA